MMQHPIPPPPPNKTTLVCSQCGSTTPPIYQIKERDHEQKFTGGKALVCHTCAYTPRKEIRFSYPAPAPAPAPTPTPTKTPAPAQPARHEPAKTRTAKRTSEK